MSFNRKNKILELIESNDVETQQQLVDLLSEEGFKATQATISRDIRELKLVKRNSETGRSKYCLPPKAENKISDRYIKILRETIKDVKAAENLIVIQTLSGCASAAAEAVDSSTTEEIVGTIAGDNTVLIIVDSKNNVDKIVSQIKGIIS